MGKIAYGTTALLAVAVVVEIIHAPVLVIFALTSLALVGLVWVLGRRPKHWATTPARASAAS